MLERAKNNINQGKVTRDLNTIFQGPTTITQELVIEEKIPQREKLGVYYVQLNLLNGLKVRMNTDSINHNAALLQVPEAIMYCEENYGQVISWNWVGEESVLRTPRSAFEAKNRDKTTIFSILKGFVCGEEDEILNIRKRHIRNRRIKENVAGFKAKVFNVSTNVKNYLIDIDDDNDCEFYTPQKRRNLKEQVQNFFSNDEEVK